MSDDLRAKLENRARGLLEEGGEECDISLSDFVDFLFSDVSEAEWVEAGLIPHEDRTSLCESVARRFL